jgi:hypothetical protein
MELPDQHLALFQAGIRSFGGGWEHETEFDGLRLFPPVSVHDATLLEWLV